MLGILIYLLFVRSLNYLIFYNNLSLRAFLVNILIYTPPMFERKLSKAKRVTYVASTHKKVYLRLFIRNFIKIVHF